MPAIPSSETSTWFRAPPGRRCLHFRPAQTLNYSSNAFLVRDGTESDFFWNGRVGASFVPYATRNFTPRLTFDQSLVSL